MMKVFFLKNSAPLLIGLLFINLTHGQEYDDLYFRKSDKKKLKVNESPAYGKDSYLYDEIDKSEGSDDDKNMLSESQQNNQPPEQINTNENIESAIVEKP